MDPAAQFQAEIRYAHNPHALLAVADKELLFLLSGTGDVIEPDDGVLAIGSGGSFALAAARLAITCNV